MKHAFLIIAHNNFKVLQQIIDLLDSDSCTFFIHFDKKVDSPPVVTSKVSRIKICEPRVDVRWGDFSQIKCELNLLEYALASNEAYDYYHIISGTHLPLSNPTGFDDYFKSNPSAVFQLMETSDYEIAMKLQRWNLCTHTFKNPSVLIERCSQLVWRFGNAFQRIAGIKKNIGGKFVKATQWCSLSHDVAVDINGKRDQILKKYKWSFCGDEFFMASEVASSIFAEGIEYRTDYLYQRFNGASPVLLDESDYAAAKKDGFLWARKFADK